MAPSPNPADPASRGDASFSSMDRLVARFARGLGLAWLFDADSALAHAASVRDPAKARRALLLGANPSPQIGRNPFWFALHTQPSPAIARLLLDAGASPDHWRDFGFEDTLGGSPIHCALSSGQWDSAWLLMSRSSSPLAPSPTGQPALASALLSLARPNRIERAPDPLLPAAIGRLIQMGADPNALGLAPGWDRASPISPFCDQGDPLFSIACFFAGQLGDALPALALLDAGADPLARNAKSFNASSFFFLGLQQKTPPSRPELSESQRSLLFRLAQAPLPLSYSAILAGFGPESSLPEAQIIGAQAQAIERSAAELHDIGSALPSPSPRAAPARAPRRL